VRGSSCGGGGPLESREEVLKYGKKPEVAAKFLLVLPLQVRTVNSWFSRTRGKLLHEPFPGRDVRSLENRTSEWLTVERIGLLKQF
jgi:hypothetical protein